MEPQKEEQVLDTNPQIPKSKKKVWLIVGILVFTLIAFLIVNNKMINKQNPANEINGINFKDIFSEQYSSIVSAIDKQDTKSCA